jgi:hypothetical protein
MPAAGHPEPAMYFGWNRFCYREWVWFMLIPFPGLIGKFKTLF